MMLVTVSEVTLDCETYSHGFVLLFIRQCVHMTASAVVNTTYCACCKHDMSNERCYHPVVIRSKCLDDARPYPDPQDGSDKGKRDEC